MDEDEIHLRAVSSRLPWRHGELTAEIIAAIQDAGPLTTRQLMRRLRQRSAHLKTAAVNKELWTTLVDVVRLVDGKWDVLGEGRFP